MVRPLRNIFLEIPYHITQRGNYRQQVFPGDEDYRQYPALLWEYAGRYRLEIWAYCLMPNHMGNLLQCRYFATPLDEAYHSRAVRYVELNPVRAKLVTAPEDWPWSSAVPHLHGDRLPGTSFLPAEALANWREYLAVEDPRGEVELIRRRTLRGRPLGTDAFISHLETLAGKPLNRERRRPRKKKIDD